MLSFCRSIEVEWKESKEWIRYLEKIASSRSFLHVDFKTTVEEVSELGTEFVRVLDLRFPIGGY